MPEQDECRLADSHLHILFIILAHARKAKMKGEMWRKNNRCTCIEAANLRLTLEMASELENSSGLAHIALTQGLLLPESAHSSAESAIRKSKKASPAASAVFMFAIPAAFWRRERSKVR